MTVASGKDLSLNAASKWREEAPDEACHLSSLHRSFHTSLIQAEKVSENCIWTQIAKACGGDKRLQRQQVHSSPDNNPHDWSNQQKVVVILLSAKWRVTTNKIWKKRQRTHIQHEWFTRRVNNILHWVFILSRSVTWSLLGVFNYF